MEESENKDPNSDFFNDLKEAALRHFNNKLELTKLTAVEKGSRIAGLLASLVVIGIVLFLFMAYASLMLGFYLSEKLGSYFYGFGAVTGVLLLVLIVVFLFRTKWVEVPVSNQIIKIIFDNDDENENS